MSIVASALTSAVVVSWSLSSTLTQLQSTAIEHDRRLVLQQQHISTLGDRGSRVAESQAANAANYSDILRRLDSIDRKLERVR